MNNNIPDYSNPHLCGQIRRVEHRGLEVFRQSANGAVLNTQVTVDARTGFVVNKINLSTYSTIESTYFSPPNNFQRERVCEVQVMSLSVVSVAMHLSGLDAQHFTSGDQKVRWLYEDSGRKLQTSSPALSTTSTASSSGFNSWASDQNNAKEDVTLTPSIPSSPKPILKPRPKPIPQQKTQTKESVIYKGRDILGLGANLRDSPWNLRYAELPKDPHHFFSNRSQYSRVNGDKMPLHVDVPCDYCDFNISHYE